MIAKTCETRPPAHRSQERHLHSAISQPAQFKVTTPTKTIRVPPRLPISPYTAVLQPSLNATGSHRPSPCGILVLTVISVRQHPLVACLGNMQDRNSLDVSLFENGGEFTTSFRTISAQFRHRHITIGARIRIPTIFHHLLVRIPPSLSAYVQSRSPTQHPPGFEVYRYPRSQGYL